MNGSTATTIGLIRVRLGMAALFALACCSVAPAADEPRSAAATVSFYGNTKAPDISGLWLGTILGEPGEQFAPGRGPADGRDPTYWAPFPLPYTPPYKKIADERAEAAKQGRQLGDTTASCLPFGMPRGLDSKSYQDEIVQTPGQVTIFVFNTFPIAMSAIAPPSMSSPSKRLPRQRVRVRERNSTCKRFFTTPTWCIT